MVTVRKISQKDWDYILYDSREGYVITVLCGTVGLFTLNIPLDDEEAAVMQIEGGLEVLANRIRTSAQSYASRSVDICEEAD